jgi:D-3-phosphoglycerate dehydrogenase / 2-oxoglutarate reductase
MNSPNGKARRVLLPRSLAQAGWTIINSRSDIEAVLFDDEATPESLHPELAHTEGIALGHTPFGEAEIAASPRLQVVARIGVGFDSVDVAALTRRRIPLMMTDTENSASVAEHTVGFMLALAKKIIEMDAAVRTGLWHDRLSRGHTDLYGKSALIIGFGRIGKRTATRCVAMEMRTFVHDPLVPAEQVRAAGCEPIDDLLGAIEQADFICILCPKMKETSPLFSEALISRMKKTAFLINTARGGMVDEVALAAALASGRIAGAAFDVFAQEPPQPDNPLLKLPNFICAPHVAGLTVEAASRMAVTTVRNIISVFDGNPNRALMLNNDVLESAPGSSSPSRPQSSRETEYARF